MNATMPPGDTRVALETTLLVHGVPADAVPRLIDELREIAESCGAIPAVCGVWRGQARADLSKAEVMAMLYEGVPKANTANLGLALFGGTSAATTVSGTMEIAAGEGVSFFATGGLGGVHRGYGTHLDVSADLAAFTRFPVAVVTSGVKSLLDVVSTREALETLGVTVIGVGTDHFPAFYLRESEAGVDARFDDLDELARFVRSELARTGRGIVLANPIPEADAIEPDRFAAWLAEANANVSATGRGITPAVLGELHRVSNGATLRANLALVRSNTRVAALLAASTA